MNDNLKPMDGKFNWRKLDSVSRLGDEDLQELVSRLETEIEEKKTEFQSVSSDVATIQATIKLHQTDRQRFSAHLLQAHKAEHLIEKTRKLNQDLESKQLHLQELQAGITTEQREVEELRKRLQVAELKSGCVEKDFDMKNKENIQAVQKLEVAYQKKKSECQISREHLEEVKREVTSLKQVEPKRRHQQGKKMDKELDKFIVACCKNAGLQLKQ